MAVTAQMRTQVSQLYVALFGRAPDSEGLGFWVQELAAGKSLVSVADTMYAVPAARAYYPSFLTNAEIVTSFYTNVLGRKPDAEGLAFWTAKLNASGATTGSVIAELVKVVVNYTGTDAAGLTSKALYMNKVAVAQYYGEKDGTIEGATDILASVTAAAASVAATKAVVDAGGSVAVPALVLAAGVDAVTGSTGNDVFEARIFDNSNSLESGDKIDGGAGNDRLNADIGASQWFAITPETTSVETVAIRAQANQNDTGDNNVAGVVQIDAERMVGVTQWESNNSRADVVIEDVRILPSQITKNITIAMVETDPGHVDFGVYFDQYSLRSSATTSASQVSIQLRDGMMADGSATPLGNLAIDGVKFTLTTPASGSKPASTTTIVLKSDEIDAASNYAQFAAALNKAIAANPDASAAKLVASVGGTFSSINGVAANGSDVLITSPSGLAFSKPTFTYSENATGAFVFLGNTSVVDATQSTQPVTSTIILDDVGRGSTGGDLVVGGLSVGDTSSSKGVERFEIEVRDNSKLETISSTNNTLEEVTIVNGVTSSSSYAYGTTVKNAGDLTVNGVSGSNGTNVTNGGAMNIAGNAALPGSAQQQANGFGFSDVRLIDGSEFKGNLAFSAEVTQASIGKYLNLQDTQARPKGDNVDFVYTGGQNDDALFVQIDGGVAASRNTIVSGREDFTFTANGGAGNDTIELSLVDPVGTWWSDGPLVGGNEAWYTNQRLNKNVFVNGGAGNDTISTPGAGNVRINGGAGHDTVYVDNTGNKGEYVFNAVAPFNADNLKSDANDSYNLFKSTLTVTFKGLTATALVPSTGYKASDLQINQAIKSAINSDAVLSKLLVANDGPGNTLVVTSLIDGDLTDIDLGVSIAVPKAGSLAGDVAAAAKAYGLAATATEAQVIAAMTKEKTLFEKNGDYNVGQLITTGEPSDATSDNTITGGAGNDVIVLGTGANSNDRVMFSAGFGNDVVVNFDATGGLGNDTLDFKAFKASGANFDSLTANGSIFVAAETTDNNTAAEVAKLFKDDATASSHVYIAYKAADLGLGTVYAVTDATGTGAGNVTAVVVGTIDLADTDWNTLGTGNFA